jgi:hypothetical protein
MTDQYRKCLEKGLEYQDFVCELLISELGIPVTMYASKKWQIQGENRQGLEIKFDDRYETTGNIYIEVAEKADANNLNYVRSGIYRDDNTWLFCIGNYSELYIFGKKHLVLMHQRGNFKEVKTPTSIGFLLDKESAEKYCLKHINID